MRIDCRPIWIYLLLRQSLDAPEIKLMQSNCVRKSVNFNFHVIKQSYRLGYFFESNIMCFIILSTFSL